MPARLVITDGTTTIDLLDHSFGFHLSSWEPAIAQYKQGGTFSDSPLADGRRLVDRHFGSVYEGFEIKANSFDQDTLIRDLQELRRLLEKAASYWATDWQNEPVWIEARASRETNLRYALVLAGTVPTDDDPFQAPFLQPNCRAVMDDLVVIVEREPFWRADQPGTGTCVPIAGYGSYCWPCHVEFDGADTTIAVPDNGVIQDLHDAAMTVEAWIRADGWGEANLGCVINKGWAAAAGWRLSLDNANGLLANVKCVTADGRAWTGPSAFTPDGAWHHVAFTWDDASYTNPRLWVDGVEQTNNTQVRNGAITTDVGQNVQIGNRAGVDRAFDGGIGWVRVSNQVLYTATFTPPAHCVLPDPTDPNTIGQWIGAECSGATIDNQEGTAAIDGTLADGSFDCDCFHFYGNVVTAIGCMPAFLEFNGVSSVLTVTDAVAIQDLHDAAITVEAWIRADGPGELDAGLIAVKGYPAAGWSLSILDPGVGDPTALHARIECATADGLATSVVGTLSWGEWVHVAFTWDDASYNYPRIWLGGVEVTYLATQNRNGAIVTDVGFDLCIGNEGGLTRTFEGDIGWVRISDVVRYAAAFTPPVRCELPDVDGNTVWLGIQEGYGSTVFDWSENNNSGIASLTTWGCDCVDVEGDVDIDPSCEE